ncbi:hypothetical protein AZI85_00885 [Bdellovibrio bacteriovorus]|uniref:Uncharacterized protein n=1 Tax=Bdellovibrio bacteriovorus TaxID=959 RepID=A0A150WW56_BDEBC|nr:hypothetical protein AZI85_00885 [Bdellovibrio bacteriovorus]
MGFLFSSLVVSDGGFAFRRSLRVFTASAGTPSRLGRRRGFASVRAIVAPAKALLRVSTLRLLRKANLR